MLLELAIVIIVYQNDILVICCMLFSVNVGWPALAWYQPAPECSLHIER